MGGLSWGSCSLCLTCAKTSCQTKAAQHVHGGICSGHCAGFGVVRSTGACGEGHVAVWSDADLCATLGARTQQRLAAAAQRDSITANYCQTCIAIAVTCIVSKRHSCYPCALLSDQSGGALSYPCGSALPHLECCVPCAGACSVESHCHDPIVGRASLRSTC